MIRIIALVLTVWCFGSSATTYAQLSPVCEQRLNKVFNNLCKQYKITGASACIIVPGKGTWTAVYGVSYHNVPVRTDMLMGISSNTKTFTAALMLKLQEMKKLRLDDTIGKWIVNKKYISGKITIRQLLNHTSGIFDYTGNPDFMDSLTATHNRVWKKESLLNMVKAPYFKPGKGWQYSNTNYVIAGIIIEQVMHQPIETVFRELIFTPQGLNHTFYYPQQILDAEVAHQWTRYIKKGVVDLSAINWPNTALFSMASSAGGIMQTAEDNAIFWHQLFSGAIISGQSLNEMMTCIDNADGVAGYGLGIYKYAGKAAINGRTCYGHGGTNFGFVSNNLVDSASKVCYTLLTNQDIFEEDDLLIKVIGKLQKVVMQLGEGK